MKYEVSKKGTKQKIKLKRWATRKNILCIPAGSFGRWRRCPLVRDPFGYAPRGRLASVQNSSAVIAQDIFTRCHAPANASPAKAQRTLKIEERGDFHARQTVPTVRLKGKWLQAAGFPPGRRVTLTVLALGVIELRLNA